MVILQKNTTTLGFKHCIFIHFQYQGIPHGIEMFCFPDAQYWSPNNEYVDDDLTSLSIGRTHFLVLTDLNGTRRFGYCRRIIPEGKKVALPLAYCIISSKRSRIYPMVTITLHGVKYIH